jgi:phosphoserine aminotransferase
MAHRVLNFAPGPATLPLPALERAQQDLIDFEGTGIGILEHSHRGKHYAAVHAETKRLLRELLGIPDGYHILFMQGGARGQFALVPMNLLRPGKSADYVITGGWAEGAFQEANVVGTAREAANTKRNDTFTRVPTNDEISVDPNAEYLHYTTNNTLYGTQFHYVPDSKGVPLVADMSSDICWKPIDVSKYALVYAGAQKNLGPAGVTLVIVRDDLVKRSRTDIPDIFRYSTVAKNDSLQNTAPTFAIYMMRNVLAWIADQGGLSEMERQNRGKAELLYGAIDAKPDFFRCPVERESRSVMNVVFRLPSAALEEKLVADAEARSMFGIKGHRSTGGIRVSLYNSMTREGTEKLLDFLHQFARENA